jgi:hypothetical protein
MEIALYAFSVYHVIKQDFDHWLDHEGCDRPDRIDIRTLLD